MRVSMLAQLAGSDLVKLAMKEMVRGGCEEVALEAEVVNKGALRLYQNLGFLRDKHLHRCVALQPSTC